MHDEPELFIPASERHQPGGWRLTLARAWCVLALIAAWFVLIAGDREVHFRGALVTLVVFYAVWQLVAWIFRPVLPPNDDRR